MDNFWDKLLTRDLALFMIKVSDETEDNDSVSRFFDFVRERIIDYKVIVVMATQWKSYDVNKQANLAVHYAGMNHASRFIMMMDYLAIKFIKGELK